MKKLKTKAFQLFLHPLKLALRLLKFGNCIVDDICDGGAARFFTFPRRGPTNKRVGKVCRLSYPIHCGPLDKIGAPSDRRVTVKSGIPEAIFSLILVLYSCKYILFPDIQGGGRCAGCGALSTPRDAYTALRASGKLNLPIYLFLVICHPFLLSLIRLD